MTESIQAIAKAKLEQIVEQGIHPYEGVANEIRTSVRAILPRVVEPVPGEHLVFGLNWHNSDYGA